MSNNMTTSLPVGTILHGEAYDYKITRILGQGSFGITYQAKVEMKGALGTLDSNMYVAIKEFFMKEVNGREGSTVTSSSDSKGGLVDYYRKKFEREAQNLSTLKHDNIVRVLESFHGNGTVYYAMEFIDGQSLDNTIINSPKGHLDETTALSYTRQIGAALSFMHNRGILHLDVKPANVMVRRDGRAFLIDFGLAKLYTSDGEPESSTKVGAGTPGYAPLEQASYREGKGFPLVMDVYALGATLFKMLTGNRPPEASEILNDGFPTGELMQAGTSTSFIACVKKAMAPLKSDRYQNVNEFLTALSAAAAGCDINEEATSINTDSSSVTDEPEIVDVERDNARNAQKAAAERQRQMEAERQRRQEAERARRLEEARKRQEAENRRQEEARMRQEAERQKRQEEEKRLQAERQRQPRREADIDTAPIDKPSSNNLMRKVIISVFVFIGIAICYPSIKSCGGVGNNGSSSSTSASVEDVKNPIGTINYADSADNKFIWTGEVLNDVPYGMGRAVYLSGDKDNRKSYDGRMVDGQRHTKEGETAKLIYNNGNEYTGTFVYDNLGTGTFIDKNNGLRYEGSFLDNSPYKGTWYYLSDGSVYQVVKP